MYYVLDYRYVGLLVNTIMLLAFASIKIIIKWVSNRPTPFNVCNYISNIDIGP